MSDGLIGTGHRHTLELLLDNFGCSSREGTSIAHDYYGVDPERRQAAAERLQAFGVTDDQITPRRLVEPPRIWICSIV